MFISCDQIIGLPSSSPVCLGETFDTPTFFVFLQQQVEVSQLAEHLSTETVSLRTRGQVLL